MSQDTAVVPPVVPAPSSLTAFFWDGARDHKLLIQHCNTCDTFQHWPEPICSTCLSFDLTPKEVSGRGSIYTFEIATQSFHPYFDDKLPFVIAVVELVEQPGLRLITNIVGVPVDQVAVGDQVEVEYHALDDTWVLPVFHPVAG